jgi:hypothetical protein
MAKMKFTAHWDYIFLHSAIYNRKCAYLNFGNSTPPQLASAQWCFFRLWQLENNSRGAFTPAFASEEGRMTIK